MSRRNDTVDEPVDSWVLGPLIAIRPDAILTPGKNDELEEFFLALALVFNDLKTAVLLQATLPRDPTGEKIGPHVGQRGGIASHLDRLAAAIVHELLKLIAGSQKVLEDRRFIDLVGKVPSECAQMWRTLVDHASGATPASSVLCMIRNNAAFHYNQPKALAQGFRAWFFDDDKIPQNETAYISIGQDMDATRFYFADAAVQRSLPVLGARKGVSNVHAIIADFVRKTNFALAALIRQYLYSRDPSSGVKPLRRRGR
jgi:hypothetical protein